MYFNRRKMKTNICRLCLKSVSLVLFLVLSDSVIAQTNVSFSGKWLFDKSKSSPDLVESKYAGSVVLEVVQNSTTISFADTYINPGNPDWKTAKDMYTIDGKEKITKHSVGTNKRMAKWSDDKKTLILTNIDTQELKGKLQDFFTTDSLSISADRKTLTIERVTKNPVQGDRKQIKVYSKK